MSGGGQNALVERFEQLRANKASAANDAATQLHGQGAALALTARPGALAGVMANVKRQLDSTRSRSAALADEAADVVDQHKKEAPPDEPAPADVAPRDGAAKDEGPSSRAKHSGAAKPKQKKAARRKLTPAHGGDDAAPSSLTPMATLRATASMVQALSFGDRDAANDAVIDALPLVPGRQQQLADLGAIVAASQTLGAFLTSDAEKHSISASVMGELPIAGAYRALDMSAFTGRYHGPFAQVGGVLGTVLSKLDLARHQVKTVGGILDVVNEVLWAARLVACVWPPLLAPVSALSGMVNALGLVASGVVTGLDLTIMSLSVVKFNDLKNDGDPAALQAMAGVLKQETKNGVGAFRQLAARRLKRHGAALAGKVGFDKVKGAVERARAKANDKLGVTKLKKRAAAWQEKRDLAREKNARMAYVAGGKRDLKGYYQARDRRVATYERIGTWLERAEYGEEGMSRRRARHRAELGMADQVAVDASLAAGEHGVAAHAQRAFALESLRAGRAGDATPITSMTSRATALHPDLEGKGDFEVSPIELYREAKALQGDDTHVPSPSLAALIPSADPPAAKVRAQSPMVSPTVALGGLLASSAETARDVPAEVEWTPKALRDARRDHASLDDVERKIALYVGRHKDMILEAQGEGDTATALRKLDDARLKLVEKNQLKTAESRDLLKESQGAISQTTAHASMVALGQRDMANTSIVSTALPAVPEGSWWQRALKWVRGKIRKLAQATIGRVEHLLSDQILGFVSGMPQEQFEAILSGSDALAAKGEQGLVDADGAGADAVAQSAALGSLASEEEQQAFEQVLSSRAAISEAMEVGARVAEMREAQWPLAFAEGDDYLAALRSALDPQPEPQATCEAEGGGLGHP